MAAIAVALSAGAAISSIRTGVCSSECNYCSSPQHIQTDTDRWGCVIRSMTDKQTVVHLIFSADSMFEGGEYALDVLDSTGVKASFFFTGNFLRAAHNKSIIRRAIAAGHYIGPHSNRHLLLCDWDSERTTLISPDSMLVDLDSNYLELSRFGIDRRYARYVLPPYEWCNRSHADAYRQAGFIPIQPTPAIQTYRDYTTPDMPEYQSSDSMLRQLFDYEKTHGLNGTNIILHLGTQDIRTDKLYRHLPAIIDTLKARGYTLRRY